MRKLIFQKNGEVEDELFEAMHKARGTYSPQTDGKVGYDSSEGANGVEEEDEYDKETRYTFLFLFSFFFL